MRPTLRGGLLQNSPNPFRPRTVIAFELPRTGLATLTVLDVAGRPVRTLLQGETAAGTHRVEWDGRDGQGTTLPAGVYYIGVSSKDNVNYDPNVNGTATGGTA